MTATSLTEDGWFMTGDILYRDNYWHFYFLDRLKSLLKYKNYQVSVFIRGLFFVYIVLEYTLSQWKVAYQSSPRVKLRAKHLNETEI